MERENIMNLTNILRIYCFIYFLGSCLCGTIAYHCPPLLMSWYPTRHEHRSDLRITSHETLAEYILTDGMVWKMHPRLLWSFINRVKREVQPCNHPRLQLTFLLYVTSLASLHGDLGITRARRSKQHVKLTCKVSWRLEEILYIWGESIVRFWKKTDLILLWVPQNIKGNWVSDSESQPILCQRWTVA
jgi:hypothetical protein